MPVWVRVNHHRDEHSAGAGLWDALRATRWPAADAHDVVSGTIGVRVFPTQYDLVWLRHIESDLRTSIATSGFTPVTAKALTGAVSEIINNVWQHAQTTIPAFLVYHLEPERVNIGIADTGTGVLNSLRTNPRYESLKTSMAALKKAMTVGVTRYEEQGHGYGFDTVLRAVADQWGASWPSDRTSNPRISRYNRRPTRDDELRRRPPRPTNRLLVRQQTRSNNHHAITPPLDKPRQHRSL